MCEIRGSCLTYERFIFTEPKNSCNLYDCSLKIVSRKYETAGTLEKSFHDFAKKVLKEFAREKHTNEYVLLSRNHKH